MKVLKKIIRKLKMLQIIRPLIWAALILGAALVFKGNESPGLILIFIITAAFMDKRLFSGSATVKCRSNKQEVV